MLPLRTLAIVITGAGLFVSWDAVTIAWDNGQVATVHHGDMREIQRVPTKRATV
jgi:hypothetical protein